MITGNGDTAVQVLQKKNCHSCAKNSRTNNNGHHMPSLNVAMPIKKIAGKNPLINRLWLTR
jgi:hypothetical protein